MSNILGIDIGGTDVKIGIVNENGNISEIVKRSVSFDNYRTPLIKTVVTEAKSYIGNTRIDGIGVSATGQIDTETGTVIGTDGKIPGWEGCNIKKIMEEEFNVPSFAINDANAAALGEQISFPEYSSMIFVTIGTGIGGGIIENGHLIMGSRGIGGEIGHIIIKYGGERCTCGNNGCYEHYASMSALIRMIKESRAIDNANIDGMQIFNSIDENSEVRNIVDTWIDYVACGLISLIHIFNPQAVIVGGGVSEQKDKFIIPLRKKVLTAVMPRFAENLHITAAKLGNKAGVYGAAQYCRTMIQEQK